MKIVNQECGCIFETLRQPGGLLGQVLPLVELLDLSEGDIGDRGVGAFIPHLQAVAQGSQQVGFPGAGGAVYVEEAMGGVLRKHQGEAVGRLVAATDHEIVETIARLNRKIEYHLDGQNSLPCGPSGQARSRWRYAARVTILPRGVRLRNPCWIKNGSYTSSMVSLSSQIAAARVSRPTGPPPNLSIMVSMISRSTWSNPIWSISRSCREFWTTILVMTPSAFTCAKSRTLRRRRLAMRGVPLLRQASSCDPSGSM